jgi:hypothetical protein
MQLTNRARGQRLTLEPTQLVIDGKTLTHILKDQELEKQLATLGALCTAVCVCRASPSQKARIVAMMREFEIAKVTDPCHTSLGRWFAKQHRNLGVRPPLTSNRTLCSAYQLFNQLE